MLTVKEGTEVEELIIEQGMSIVGNSMELIFNKYSPGLSDGDFKLHGLKAVKDLKSIILDKIQDSFLVPDFYHISNDLMDKILLGAAERFNDSLVYWDRVLWSALIYAGLEKEDEYRGCIKDYELGLEGLSLAISIDIVSMEF